MAHDLRSLYADATVGVLQVVRRAVLADLRDGTPGSRGEQVRQRVSRIVEATTSRALTLLAQQVEAAAAAADVEARADLRAAQLPEGSPEPIALSVADAAGMLQRAGRSVVTAAVDAYLDAINDPQRIDDIMRRLADEGVRGRDSLGRRWELSGYAATIEQVAVRNARLSGYLHRMSAATAALGEVPR